MARELGGSQISALLEAVPGIRSVLRSPVADAIVHMIRAAAGLEGFRLDQVQELVQYSVRRGLISADEGDELMQEVSASAKGRRAAAKARKAKPAKKAAKRPLKKQPGKKQPAKKAAKKKTAKKPAKKKPTGKKPVKKVKKR
jgi:polyhydroxyalkanoate synthesis regulator phasin